MLRLLDNQMATLRWLILFVICLCATARAQGNVDVHGVMRELAKELQRDDASVQYVIVAAARPGHEALNRTDVDLLAQLLGAAVLDSASTPTPCPSAPPPQATRPKGYELHIDEPSLDDTTAVVSVEFGCQQFRLGHIFGFGKDVDYFFAKTDEGWRFIRSRVTRIT
jgi:hypothetical protein